MIINGKRYPNRELDYNAICALEDNGVSLTDMHNKSMSLMRAYAAQCMRMSAEAAGKEIQEHIMGGGDFAEIAEAFNAEVERSGFFQALKAKATKDQEPDQEPETPKKK